MDMQTAIAVLGPNRTRDWDLRPVVIALSLHPWLNTAAENQRLEAARYVLRRWKAYVTAAQAVRDRRISRTA